MKNKNILLNIPFIILIVEAILFVTWRGVLFDIILTTPVLREIIILAIPVIAVCFSLYLALISHRKNNAVAFMCYLFMFLMAILVTPIMVMLYIMSLGSF